MGKSKKYEIVSVLNNLKTCYEAPGDSLGDDFLKPCLKECNLYKRETAWFRSSVIRVWGDALVNIVNKENAKIEIIAYPQIDKSTKRALDETANENSKNIILQKHREKILLKVLSIDVNREKHTPQTGSNIGQMLAYLIADKKLEIRFATCINHDNYLVVEDDEDEGKLAHVKRGYFEFDDGITISFSGSANESHAGLMSQGEAFDVFDSREINQSWKVNEHVQKIDDTWDGLREGYKIERVSKELLNKIKVFVDRTRIGQTPAPTPAPTPSSAQDKIVTPDFFWKHKHDAINIFLEKKKGVLEMATGTGKTSTALEIARQLYLNKLIDKILICPNDKNTLCNQWLDEVYNWKDEYNINLPVRKFFDGTNDAQKYIDSDIGILIVNRRPEKLEKILAKLNNKRTLIIQDEVHGFGSPSMQVLKGLHKDYQYTLGLSATPTRKFDSDGTKFIYEELGDIVYKFELNEAIRNGILCPFNYFPLKVELTKEERKKRKGLFARFNEAKKGIGEPYNEKEFRNDMANVKKNAENKEYVFSEFISKKPELLNNSIIFCHTKKQAQSLGKYVHNHTSRYSNYFDEGADRNNLLRLGKDLDCVLSCHILSEGIDIPSLENIFILASPSDRRETIQRIGRCLRTDKRNPNKEANVIDFIVHNNVEEEPLKADKERLDWLSEDSKVRKLKNG